MESLGLPNHFGGDVLAVLAFGLLAVLLVTLGSKAFDWLYRKVDFEAEIVKGNLAAAGVLAAVILGICYVAAAVVKAVCGGGG